MKFQWDFGNVEKNLKKHGVRSDEAEECFREPSFFWDDEKHSTEEEKRYFLLGETKVGRELAIVYTLRGEAIRVISARPMNRKERHIYENLKTERSAEVPE